MQCSFVEMGRLAMVMAVVVAVAVAVAVAAVAGDEAAAPLPLPQLSPDGRGAVIAHGTSPVPVGLYAMVFADYPATSPPGAHGASCGRLSRGGWSQYPPMTAEDWSALVGNGYISAVSLHFSWGDIQPDPPPAPLSFDRLTAALVSSSAITLQNSA